MTLLLGSFLAEDNTGNRFKITIHQERRKINFKTSLSDPYHLYNGTPVSELGDDLYYLTALDTEVKKITV